MSRFARRIQSASTGSVSPVQQGAQFVTNVSQSGRYFVDQSNQPVLVRGESPWSAFADLSTAEWELWCANRAGHGFNFALVSLVGSLGNGSPADTGATYDGILPFTGGNVTTPNAAYWTRIDQFIDIAESHGMTLMVFAMDGWNTPASGRVFSGASAGECGTYGAFLGNRYASRRVMWGVGGDYTPDGGTVDAKFWACLQAIRAAGATQPRTIQLDYFRSWSTQSSTWRSRVDFNFVYSYMPTYEAVSGAYADISIPALFSEGNYEGENAGSTSPATTNETLRRQVAWSLTSGSPGDMFGSDDWEFNPGWASRLDTAAVSQINSIRNWFEALPQWHLLAPDTALVTAGRGTAYAFPGGDPKNEPFTDVLQNNYVTVARNPDGSLATVYLPDARNAVTVSWAAMGSTNQSASWVDPANGTIIAATPGATTYSRSVTNSDSGHDWLLLLRADAL